MAESKISCPKCAGHVAFPKEMAGQVAACPHCGESILLSKSKFPIAWVVTGRLIIICLAGAAVFVCVEKKLEKSNKELDDFAALAADRGLTINDATRKAFVEVLSEEKASALKKHFDDMATAMERYNTAAQQAAALAKELREIELAKTDAADAAENASDDLRVKQGTMTKEQAELNRLNRAAAEEKAKVAKEEADRAGDIAEKQAERDYLATEIEKLKKEKAALPKPDLIVKGSVRRIDTKRPPAATP
jgi:DNA-directed RNA polymerase subunit RPC12/RpoP